MITLIIALLAAPVQAAPLAPQLQFTSLEQILRHSRDEGCVNPGGTCNGKLPCCGEAACYRNRCVAMPAGGAPDSIR